MATKVRKSATKPARLFERVREILEAARVNVARTVNTTQVIANWLIGRKIFEEEQRGKKRADYGHKALADLSARLGREYGRGYSVDNLEAFRRFYLDYSRLNFRDGVSEIEPSCKFRRGAPEFRCPHDSTENEFHHEWKILAAGRVKPQSFLDTHTIAHCCALAASRREDFMNQTLINNLQTFLPELCEGMLFRRDAR